MEEWDSSTREREREGPLIPMRIVRRPKVIYHRLEIRPTATTHPTMQQLEVNGSTHYIFGGEEAYWSGEYVPFTSGRLLSVPKAGERREY